MKRFSMLAVCAVALFSNACEQHKATELEAETKHLPQESQTPSGKSTIDPQKPAPELEAPAAPSATPAPAPKFFPEAK
jgi:hypothetical protein